jgi:hypothetical protein
MIKRRVKRLASRLERWDLLQQVRLAATYVADIFEIVVALIGSAAIIAIQIRRDRRDRSSSSAASPVADSPRSPSIQP